LVVNCAFAQGVIDDLLHELGQPLTALKCSLDLALRKKSSEQELLGSLKQAAVLTDIALKIASSQRQLLEADNPGKVVRMDLADAVRTIADDFAPVVESSGKTMQVLANHPAPIDADPERMSRVLFAAVDLALYRLPEQKTLLLAAYHAEGDVICYVGEDRVPLPGTVSSLDLRLFAPGGVSEVVARMVGAAGGSAWEVFLQNYSAFLFRFPAAA
jgi:signal transduction histidine kinase